MQAAMSGGGGGGDGGVGNSGNMMAALAMNSVIANTMPGGTGAAVRPVPAAPVVALPAYPPVMAVSPTRHCTSVSED